MVQAYSFTNRVGVHRLWQRPHYVYVYISTGCVGEQYWSAQKLCRCTENNGVFTSSVGVWRMLKCSLAL